VGAIPQGAAVPGRKTARPWAFIGAVNWAAFVPRADPFGIRGDRCGFGWAMQDSLSNFGKSFGVAGAKVCISYIQIVRAGPSLPF